MAENAYDTTFVKARNKALYVFKLAKGVRTPPSSITLTVAAGGAAVDDTTIPLSSALTVAIPAGVKLTLTGGKTVFTSAETAIGATNLNVDPLLADLSQGDSATWDQLVRVIGLESLSFQGTDNTTTLQANTYEQAEAVIWDDTTTKSKGWSYSGAGLYKPTDAGFKIVRNAWLQDDELYIKVLYPDETGAYAEQRTGVVGVTGYSGDGNPDQIEKVQFTLPGKGEPVFTDL